MESTSTPPREAPDLEANSEGAVGLELSGPDWEEFQKMMSDTVLNSDLVRIDWLLERVATLEFEIAQNNETADRRIEMQEDFRQGENAKLQGAITHWTREIATLAPASGEAFKKEYGGKKSRQLAHGKFGYTQCPDSVVIADDEKALAYATENGLQIKRVVQVSISKNELKAHAKNTGVSEGEGWRLVPGADEFYVKAGK